MKTKPLLILSITVVLFWTSCKTTKVSTLKSRYKKLSPFAVSYEKITPNQATIYDLLIVEPQHYNKAEIKALKANGATILAYLSVGEVGKDRWYFDKMKERGFLGRNENWDSYYINLEDPVTYSLFFDEIIPDIMIRGFDGLFLDTVDDIAPYTSRNQLQPQMVKLIRQIHSTYPDAMMVQNGGLFLLDETAPIVDAVLIEDVATNYNFEDKLYALKQKEAFKNKVQTINTISKKYSIPFLIVDFALSGTTRTSAKRRLDSLSYPYYIGNIELDNISDGITGNNY